MAFETHPAVLDAENVVDVEFRTSGAAEIEDELEDLVMTGVVVPGCEDSFESLAYLRRNRFNALWPDDDAPGAA